MKDVFVCVLRIQMCICFGGCDVIKCVYEKNKSGVRLTVNGHARYAQHGEDIVCSAVSALTETLIARLLELNAKFSYKKEPGAVEIAMNRVTYDANEAFNFAVLGMQLIATAYPKCVELQKSDTRVKQ